MITKKQVLRLSNMITRDDLYNESEYLDIREDVRLECQQYGKVHSVVIPRAKDGFSPAAECLIFVEFETLEGSRAAANVLNGRKFADNTVVVAYVSTAVIVYNNAQQKCALHLIHSLCGYKHANSYYAMLQSALYVHTLTHNIVTIFVLHLQYNERDFATQHLI